MNLADLALEAAVLKVLGDEIAARRKAINERLQAGFTSTGTTQTVPSLPGGTRVATASLAGAGGKSVIVLHEIPFLAWAKENYPGEIEERVRDSFRKKLLDGAKEAQAPIDTATGQVIPGIAVRDSVAYISLRLKKGGAEAIVQAWLDGTLKDIQILAVPQVESAEGDAAA